MSLVSPTKKCESLLKVTSTWSSARWCARCSTPPGARLFLTPATLTALKANAATATSAAGKIVKTCNDIIATPAQWSHMPGYDFRWGVAATSCGMAYQITGNTAHATAGLAYLNALLDD